MILIQIVCKILWISLFISSVSSDCQVNTSNFDNDIVKAYESVSNCGETIVLIIDREIKRGMTANITEIDRNDRIMEISAIETGKISTNLILSGFNRLSFNGIVFTKTGSLTLSNINSTFIQNSSFSFAPQTSDLRDLFVVVSLSFENGGSLYISDSVFSTSSLGILTNGGNLFLERTRFDNNSNGAFESNNGRVEARDLRITNNTSLNGIIRLINCSSVLSNIEMATNIALVSGGSIAISGESHTVLDQINISNSLSTLSGGSISVVGGGRVNMSRLTISSSTSSSGGAISCVQENGRKLSIFLQQFQAEGVSSYREGGVIYINGADFYLSKAVMTRSTSLNGGTMFLGGSINNLVLEDIQIFNSEGEAKGGAIRSLATLNNFVIRNAVFFNCTSLIGGAISLSGSMNSFTLDSVQFLSNSVLLYGGSIDIDAKMNQFVMTGGLITKSNSPLGGSMRINSNSNEIRIEKTRFQDNYSSDKGGALLIFGSHQNISITNSVFEENHSESFGGGIHMEGFFTSINVQGCEMNDNQGVVGGGMSLKADNSSLFMRDCTFNNNTAFTSNGGGVYVDGRFKQIAVYDSQFIDNQATIGGGLFVSAFVSNFLLEGNEFDNNTAMNSGGGFSINKKFPMPLNGTNTISMTRNSFGSNNAMLGRDVEMNHDSISVQGNVFSNGGFFVSQNSTVIQSDDNLSPFVCPSGLIPTNTKGNFSEQISCKKAPPDLSGLIIGLTVAGGFVCMMTIPIIYFLVRLRKQKKLIKKQRIEMEDWSNVDLGAAKRSVLNLNEFKDMVEIGSGAFGVVYRAQWRELQIAVKQMKDVSGISKQMTEFLREVAILQRLRSHPNVVLFLGITVPPQNLSLVTEFCEGGSLYHYLRKNSVSENQKNHFIEGIAKGMLHLHYEGVIHRDLAVRNILLTKHLDVKVSDFGLSREQDSEAANVTTTSVGPLKWMAPESILSREYSNKSDVFSFGVVIWEILTASDPWPNMGVLEAAMAVAKEGARLPIYDWFNKTLADLMKECWATNPEDRPDFARICGVLDDTPEFSSSLYPQMHRSEEYLDTSIQLDENMYIATVPDQSNDNQSQNSDSSIEGSPLMKSQTEEINSGQIYLDVNR
eukprot:TRINITY_DN2962_c0_g1_i2.p1 TRINITY_DN2962_c0_g1~~TRINITY_DN2962_c0_g1_i2.p1  ORF type:complete len:1112 (-),score=374.17 TRINITY_DN2962_c0_g1_i2:72-3407(-)